MYNLGDCDEICVNHPRCLSYNYQFDTRSPKHSCEINDATGTVCPQDMVPRRGYRYYEDQVNELTSCCITKFIESRSKEILMVVVSTQSLQHMGIASYGRVSRTIPYFFNLFFFCSRSNLLAERIRKKAFVYWSHEPWFSKLGNCADLVKSLIYVMESIWIVRCHNYKKDPRTVFEHGDIQEHKVSP